MLVFVAEIFSEDVAAYMSTIIVPEYLRNMQLAPVQFQSNDREFGGGQQILKLLYTTHGRVEDYELEAEEHAFPLLLNTFPALRKERICRAGEGSLWTWDSGNMRIHFTPRDPLLRQNGPPYDISEVYVSISRGQLFFSYQLLEHYFRRQFQRLGLEWGEGVEVKWDDGLGGILCATERVKVQWILTEEREIEDILHFAQMSSVLADVRPWVLLDFEEWMRNPPQFQTDGILFPLKRVTWEDT
ncbi:MAG: hypothetical protein Q4D62_08805 [Planctomycetia bacterium]|nr:hypothetical protein [Planctomycetia bacterium]